ncbi:MAG: helix-turn-helix transcriptional regulator, partial [Aminobacteriaceae bacterium]
LSGLIFSAAGAALMLGMWGMSLTSLIPDDVAVVFGLAPLAALLLLVASASASLFNSLFLLIVVPLLSMILLFYSAEESIEGQFEAAAVPLPFWRLSVFLFCLYAANGFLLELRPALFHPTAAATAGHDALLRVASTLAAAAAFRFYPRAELKTFYKGAFPFIATALFLMAFTPVYTPPRLLLETGLAFLDLYAWLLLIYFASRAGRRRKAVVHGGLFLIVLAEGAVHLAVLPREAGYLALLVPGVCLLLLMLVLWDGREVPLQAGQTGEGPAPATVVEGADDDRGEELFLRAKLMEFNLTRQETEIALLLLKGQKDRSICSMLFITQNTLKYHLRNIYRKTGTANRLDLRENLG